MQKAQVRFPIRLKLMLAMVLFSGVFLAAFAQIAIDNFRNDKTASIYESLLGNTTSAAALANTELTYARDRLQVILSGFDSQSRDFQPLAESTFAANSRLESVVIFLPGAGDQLEVSGRLDQSSPPSVNADTLLVISKRAFTNEAAIQAFPESDRWAVAIRFYDPMSRKYGVAVATSVDAKFLKPFLKGGRTFSFLVDSKGRSLLPISDESAFQAAESALTRMSAVQPEAIRVEKLKSGGTPFLVSTTKLMLFDWILVSIVPEQKATAALSKLVITLAAVLVFLISVAVAASVLLARGLTTNISRLHQAVQEVSDGNLEARVDVKSRDEVGELSQGFNHMTLRIRELINETKEKARMESELKTAQVVQSTLFPTQPLVLNESEVRGLCLPASECSGDWWNYQAIGDRVYVALGDATGHGVPAALVTSAARSAMALLENFEGLTVSERLAALNQAIFATTRGKIQMTLFLCCLDTRSGIFTYSNASHDPPFSFPVTGVPLKRSQVEALTAVNGRRLGEAADSKYEEQALQLEPGQVIAITTDGLTELVGENGDLFGERRLMKLYLENFNSSRELGSVIESVTTTVSEFRGQTPLKDDVTFCVIRYGPAPLMDRGSENATV